MRKVAALALASVLAVAGTPLARGAEPAPAPDWVVVKISVSKPTQVVIQETFPFESEKTGPVMYGIGQGGQTQASVGLLYAGESNWSITTTRDLGAIDRDLPGSPAHLVNYGGRIDHHWPLEPGEPLVLVRFVTHAHFTALPLVVVPAEGVSVETRTGTGADVMTIADPRDGGLGASAGPAGVARVRREGVARTGVVGSFFWDCNCTGDWTSPDGRTGRWVATRTYTELPLWIGALGDGRFTFAGPAGPWSLSWTGAAMPHPVGIAAYGSIQPIVAAWAPIGPDWVHFEDTVPPLVVR